MIVSPLSGGLYAHVGQVDLDRVAVKLDFVNPPITGRVSIEDARAGLTNPRRDACRPIASVFYAETPLQNSINDDSK